MKRLNLLLLMLAVAFLSQVQAVVYLDLDGNKVESSYTASNDFMEMYLADEPNGAAIMVYPGGAYAWKSMDYEGRYFAEFYNRYGISVFVVSYALPYGQCTVPLKSVERGMRGIKAHAEQYHIDPDRIGVMGSSAGGHLASTHATHFSVDTRPAFQVLLYPVITMDATLTHAESRANIIGQTPSETDIALYSNELRVRENTPPAYIIVSQDDIVVPVENSIRYYKSLLDHNVPAELHVVPTGGHGWGSSETFAYHDMFYETLGKWLEKYVVAVPVE